MPFQLYTEWADTRTNGKVQGISYNHSVDTDGFYQHGYPLAHAMGGDGQMLSVGDDIRLDHLNRVNTRILYLRNLTQQLIDLIEALLISLFQRRMN